MHCSYSIHLCSSFDAVLAITLNALIATKISFTIAFTINSPLALCAEELDLFNKLSLVISYFKFVAFATLSTRKADEDIAYLRASVKRICGKLYDIRVASTAKLDSCSHLLGFFVSQSLYPFCEARLSFFQIMVPGTLHVNIWTRNRNIWMLKCILL